MEWLKLAHVLCMFAAVAIVEGPMLFVGWAIRERDVPGIRRLVVWSARSEAIGTPLALVGIALGLAAGLAGSINLLASWLVVTYAIFIGATVYGVLGERHMKRVQAALDVSPDDVPSTELMGLVTQPFTRSLYIAPPFIMGTILLLMITKPSLW